MRLTTEQLVYRSKSPKMEIKISNVLGYIKCTDAHAWGFCLVFFHHVGRETIICGGAWRVKGAEQMGRLQSHIRKGSMRFCCSAARAYGERISLLGKNHVSFIGRKGFVSENRICRTKSTCRKSCVI